MTRAELLPQIFKLDDHDQLMIAEAIRNHLAGSRAPLDETAFKAELSRRVADADTNPAKQSPLADVVGRLRSRK